MAKKVPKAPKKNRVNKHIGLKETVGWGTYTVASYGITAAQMATGTSTSALVAAVAAGGAVSATGVGLVAAAGALTIGNTYINAKAAHKTRKHRANLREIFRNRYHSSKYDCYGVGALADWNEHNQIAEQILPYVIEQKSKKYGRRVRYAIPGVNLLSTFRAVGTKGWKALRRTLGEERKEAAKWMTGHLFTHNCDLVEAIIAELFSYEEMLWMKMHADEEVATTCLAHKLRST